MKYRIKDLKARKAVKEIFDFETFDSVFPDTELKITLSFAKNSFAVNFFETEPIRDLAEGWNPYPETKPEAECPYLCVIHHKASDSVFHSVIKFTNNRFEDWNSQVFAWRELPKTWKDL